MENKNSPSSIVVNGETFVAIRLLKKGNTLCRDHHQASLLEEAHNIRLLWCYGKEKCYEECAALRLDIIMAHSLYPRIFTKQQQKILKEALEKRKDKELLYVK